MSAEAKKFWKEHAYKFATGGSPEEGLTISVSEIMQSYAESYVNQELKNRIESITDEEIEKFKESRPYYGHCNHEYLEGINDGSKWLKTELLKQTKN